MRICILIIENIRLFIYICHLIIVYLIRKGNGISEFNLKRYKCPNERKTIENSVFCEWPCVTDAEIAWLSLACPPERSRYKRIDRHQCRLIEIDKGEGFLLGNFIDFIQRGSPSGRSLLYSSITPWRSGKKRLFVCISPEATSDSIVYTEFSIVIFDKSIHPIMHNGRIERIIIFVCVFLVEIGFLV